MTMYRDNSPIYIFSAMIIACAFILVGNCSCGPASAPYEVLDRTFDGDNIIHNYEWFYDANAQISAKARAIKSHKALVDDAVGAEKNRLQMELTGMQNVCRELVQEYNANSKKVNRNIFKGKDIPELISMDECETINE